MKAQESNYPFKQMMSASSDNVLGANKLLERTQKSKLELTQETATIMHALQQYKKENVKPDDFSLEESKNEAMDITGKFKSLSNVSYCQLIS